MDWLEKELQTALGREDPPADFAERAIRRAERRAAPQWPRWLAAAAVVVLTTGAGLGYRQYRGEAAKEQVMQAFKIASAKVNHIQTQVREIAQ